MENLFFVPRRQAYQQAGVEKLQTSSESPLKKKKEEIKSAEDKRKELEQAAKDNEKKAAELKKSLDNIYSSATEMTKEWEEKADKVKTLLKEGKIKEWKEVQKDSYRITGKVYEASKQRDALIKAIDENKNKAEILKTQLKEHDELIKNYYAEAERLEKEAKEKGVALKKEVEKGAEARKVEKKKEAPPAAPEEKAAPEAKEKRVSATVKELEEKLLKVEDDLIKVEKNIDAVKKDPASSPKGVLEGLKKDQKDLLKQKTALEKEMKKAEKEEEKKLAEEKRQEKLKEMFSDVFDLDITFKVGHTLYGDVMAQKGPDKALAKTNKAEYEKLVKETTDKSNELVRALYKAGVSPNMFNENDRLRVKNGVLYIDRVRGEAKNQAIKLYDDAVAKTELEEEITDKDGNKKTVKTEGYIDVTKPEGIKKEIAYAHRHIEKREDTLTRGTLFDILTWYGVNNNFETRGKIWTDMGKDAKSEPYKGSLEQNMEMSKWLRNTMKTNGDFLDYLAKKYPAKKAEKTPEKTEKEAKKEAPKEQEKAPEKKELYKGYDLNEIDKDISPPLGVFTVNLDHNAAEAKIHEAFVADLQNSLGTKKNKMDWAGTEIEFADEKKEAYMRFKSVKKIELIKRFIDLNNLEKKETPKVEEKPKESVPDEPVKGELKEQQKEPKKAADRIKEINDFCTPRIEAFRKVLSKIDDGQKTFKTLKGIESIANWSEEDVEKMKARINSLIKMYEDYIKNPGSAPKQLADQRDGTVTTPDEVVEESLGLMIYSIENDIKGKIEKTPEKKAEISDIFKKTGDGAFEYLKKESSSFPLKDIFPDVVEDDIFTITNQKEHIFDRFGYRKNLKVKLYKGDVIRKIDHMTPEKIKKFYNDTAKAIEQEIENYKTSSNADKKSHYEKLKKRILEVDYKDLIENIKKGNYPKEYPFDDSNSYQVDAKEFVGECYDEILHEEERAAEKLKEEPGQQAVKLEGKEKIETKELTEKQKTMKKYFENVVEELDKIYRETLEKGELTNPLGNLLSIKNWSQDNKKALGERVNSLKNFYKNYAQNPDKVNAESNYNYYMQTLEASAAKLATIDLSDVITEIGKTSPVEEKKVPLEEKKSKEKPKTLLEQKPEMQKIPTKIDIDDNELTDLAKNLKSYGGEGGSLLGEVEAKKISLKNGLANGIQGYLQLKNYNVTSEKVQTAIDNGIKNGNVTVIITDKPDNKKYIEIRIKDKEAAKKILKEILSSQPK